MILEQRNALCSLCAQCRIEPFTILDTIVARLMSRENREEVPP